MTIVERYSQSGLYSPKRLKESGERTTVAMPPRGVFSNSQQQHGKHYRKKKKFKQFFSCLPQQQRRYYQEKDDEEYPDSPSSTVPLMMEEELSISNNPYYASAVIADEVVGNDSPLSIEVTSSLPRSPSVMGKDLDGNDDYKVYCNDDERRSDIDSINKDNSMIDSSAADRDREGVMIRWKARINHCLKKALHHRRKGDNFKGGDNVSVMSNKHPSRSQPTLAAENLTYATECNVSEDSSLQVGGNLTRSNRSAFSPVEQVSSTEDSIYPTQERRKAPLPSPKVEISLYPYQVEVKEVPPNSSPTSTGGSGGFLAVSIEEECAQLVVQSPSAFDDDEISTSSLLGVAFPYHSAPHGTSSGGDNTNGKHCLGVSSSHPNWLKQRVLDDVWDRVESDPLEGGSFTAPPSPTFVQTKTYGARSWSNEEMSVTTMDDSTIGGIVPSQQEIENIFSSVYKPICCLAQDVTNGGAYCASDSGMLALDDELSDIHGVPFDEFRFDKATSSSGLPSRKGIDPDMMLLSQFSSDDCGSLVQPYLDDESLSGDGWTDYSDAVADMYTSMLGEMETKEE